jgi:hemerythrin superfamily protein
MGELINLEDYRRKRDEDEIEKLKMLLDQILAYMPDMEQQAYFIQDEMVYHMPLSSSQTNLDGYYTDNDDD